MAFYGRPYSRRDEFLLQKFVDDDEEAERQERIRPLFRDVPQDEEVCDSMNWAATGDFCWPTNGVCE